MKKTTIRLLYDSATTKAEEREAAFSGISRFRALGVIIEEMDIRAKGAIDSVKRGKVIREQIISPAPPPLHANDFINPGIGEFFGDFFRPNSILGVAITIARLREMTENGEEGRIGISFPWTGAIISISKSRGIEDIGLKLKSIELATLHEVGHSLGIKGHCSNDCLMQENDNHEDFIRRFVKPSLDFCKDCIGRLRSSVNDRFWDAA